MTSTNEDNNKKRLPSSKRYQVDIEGLDRNQTKWIIKMVRLAQCYGASEATIADIRSKSYAGMPMNTGWSLDSNESQ